MVTVDTKVRVFHCKMLNISLFVNKAIFKLKKVEFDAAQS